MKRDEHEMITLYYGEGVEEADCEALAAKVSKNSPTATSIIITAGSPYITTWYH